MARISGNDRMKAAWTRGSKCAAHRRIHDRQRLLLGPGGTVGAIRRQRVEHVGHRHDPRLQRNRLAGQPVRIAAAVPFLVMRQGDRGRHLQHRIAVLQRVLHRRRLDRVPVEQRHHRLRLLAEDALADLAVPLHDRPIPRRSTGRASAARCRECRSCRCRAAGPPAAASPGTTAAFPSPRPPRGCSSPRESRGCPCLRRGTRPPCPAGRRRSSATAPDRRSAAAPSRPATRWSPASRPGSVFVCSTLRSRAINWPGVDRLVQQIDGAAQQGPFLQVAVVQTRSAPPPARPWSCRSAGCVRAVRCRSCRACGRRSRPRRRPFPAAPPMPPPGRRTNVMAQSSLWWCKVRRKASSIRWSSSTMRICFFTRLPPLVSSLQA